MRNVLIVQPLIELWKLFIKQKIFITLFNQAVEWTMQKKRIIKNYNLVIGRGRCMHFLRQKWVYSFSNLVSCDLSWSFLVPTSFEYYFWKILLQYSICCSITKLQGMTCHNSDLQIQADISGQVNRLATLLFLLDVFPLSNIEWPS